MKGTNLGITYVSIAASGSRDWRNPPDMSIMTVCVVGDIRTLNLQEPSHKRVL